MNLPRTKIWKYDEIYDFSTRTREDSFQYKTDIISNLASQTPVHKHTRNFALVDNNI